MEFPQTIRSETGRLALSRHETTTQTRLPRSWLAIHRVKKEVFQR